jgi:hypothetical protein
VVFISDTGVLQNKKLVYLKPWVAAGKFMLIEGGFGGERGSR